MKNNIIHVAQEMLQQAAEEIGFTYDEGCLEHMLTMLRHSEYEMVLTPETKITWQSMVAITDIVHQWQTQTKSTM